MWNLDAERDLWADIGQRSFWHFCNDVIGLRRISRATGPWWQEYIHRPMCEWFQHHIDDWQPKRNTPEAYQLNLMCLVPREYAKTSVFTKCGQLWLHLRDPDFASCIGSETVSQSIQFLSTIQQYIRGGDPTNWFTWCWGTWYDKSRLWRAERLVHGARRTTSRSEPSFDTWGVETGLTSTHNDALFFDDPISYDRLTVDSSWFEKVNQHVADLGPVLKANGLMVWVGTRYGESDHFGVALENEGVASINGMSLPSPPRGKLKLWHCYYMSGRDRTNMTPEHPEGVPTFPEQWPEWRLQREKARNQMKYAAQLLNDPTASDTNEITYSQACECIVKPKDVPWHQLIYSIHGDTAFVLKRQAKGDFSVLEVWGHQVGTGNVYFIEAHYANNWRTEDYNKKLLWLLQKYSNMRRRIFVVTDEAEMGGKAGTWEQLIRKDCNTANIICPPIKLFNRGGTQKEMRVVTAKNYWVAGFVHLVDGAPGLDDLIKQVSTPFLQLPHDDLVDAMADVFHPDIYTPVRRGAKDVQPTIVRPYDEYLLTGRLSGSAMQETLQNWDRQQEDASNFAAEPIGPY